MKRRVELRERTGKAHSGMKDTTTRSPHLFNPLLSQQAKGARRTEQTHFLALRERRERKGERVEESELAVYRRANSKRGLDEPRLSAASLGHLVLLPPLLCNEKCQI